VNIYSGEQARNWIIVDSSQAGEVRITAVQPSERPRIGDVCVLNVNDLPTFTDALQSFERQTGCPLNGSECVIAIGGATSGEALPVARSRWTITRPGLQAVFGRPVTVINDVAARAWAIRSGTASLGAVRGYGQPSLEKPGRMLMLMIDEGLGACCIDIDRDRQVRMLETEAGHTDFSPSDENQQRLATALRGNAPQLSWEAVLARSSNEPEIVAALPHLSDSERAGLLAGIAGRLCVNLIMAYGAWSGVILTGCRAPRLLSDSGRRAFEAQFATKRTFSRLIMATPVWSLAQREPVLTGAAEILAHHYAAASIKPAMAAMRR